MTNQEKYKELKQKQNEIRLQLSEVAKETLEEYFKTYFDKFSGIKIIQWTAYTPYFNDGDPCTYSSGHDYPDINDFDYTDEEEYLEESENKEIWKYDDERYKEAERELRDFLGMYDNDDMYELFGDHCRVIISKQKGIEVSEYDHD